MAITLSTSWQTVKSWSISDNHIAMSYEVKYSDVDANTKRIYIRSAAYLSLKASISYRQYGSVSGYSSKDSGESRWTGIDITCHNPSDGLQWDVPANWSGTLSASASVGDSSKCYEGTSDDPYYYDFYAPNWSDSASFPTNTITLSVTPSGGGTVSGAGTYTNGSSRSISATPATDYTFVKWVDNKGNDITNNPYTFTLTSDVSFQANFVLNPLVTISANPTAGGTISGGGRYAQGSSVTLSAQPNDGYAWDAWYDSKGDVVSYPNVYTFTMGSSDVSYKARFIKVYTISLQSNNTKYGTVGGSGIRPEGSNVTITATPTYKGIFLGWYDGNTLLTRDKTYTFTLSSDVLYIARFCPANINRSKIAD